jgi:hypothetical protein
MFVSQTREITLITQTRSQEGPLQFRWQSLLHKQHWVKANSSIGNRKKQQVQPSIDVFEERQDYRQYTRIPLHPIGNNKSLHNIAIHLHSKMILLDTCPRRKSNLAHRHILRLGIHCSTMVPEQDSISISPTVTLLTIKNTTSTRASKLHTSLPNVIENNVYRFINRLKMSSTHSLLPSTRTK